MFNKLFKRNKPEADQYAGTPNIMGLRLTGSFDVDPLWLKMVKPYLVAAEIAPSQIIQAVGTVDWDDTKIYRFYTDEEAWLQVVATGDSEADVVDVTLFHYYDTLNIGSKAAWDELLNQKIGQAHYELEGHRYERVWTTEGDYHAPVHMREHTCEDNTGNTETDQFTMLFQREIGQEGEMEMLFVSAEESLHDNVLERCLVLSTGIKLTPTQLTIHG